MNRDWAEREREVLPYRYRKNLENPKGLNLEKLKLRGKLT